MNIRGKSISVDSQGAVCELKNIESDGCCNEYYSVNDSCSLCSQEFSCCNKYEHCVSCCIKTLLKDPLLKKKGLKGLLAKWLSDEYTKILDDYKESFEIPYDWCTVRCRTSSKSVVHQSQYRSDLKHCYGKKGPPLIIKS